MGGGKETPRQKMVGLMYLVLMALLAMNVSKEIINAFVTLNNKLENSIAQVESFNTELSGRLDSKLATLEATGAPKEETDRVKKHKESNDEVINLTRKMCNDLVKRNLYLLISAADASTLFEEFDGIEDAIVNDNEESKGRLKKLVEKVNALAVVAADEHAGEDHGDGHDDPYHNNLFHIDDEGYIHIKDLSNYSKKDDYDTPTRLLAGESFETIAPEGQHLMDNLHHYRNDLISLIANHDGTNKATGEKIQFAFDTTAIEDPDYLISEQDAIRFANKVDSAVAVMVKEGKVDPLDQEACKNIWVRMTIQKFVKNHGEDYPWIFGQFDHAPIVAASAVMTSLRSDVLQVQTLASQLIDSRVKVASFNFNKIDPLAFASTSYINAGDSLGLKVMIAAYDSSEAMELHYWEDDSSQYLLTDGEQDKSKMQKFQGKAGQQVNISGSIGDHTLSGLIAVKEKGVKKWKPWQFKYSVGSPSAAIENADLLVLYGGGWKNKMFVSASGYKSESVKVSGTNCRISGPDGKGMYTAIVPDVRKKKAIIRVSAVDDNGKVVELAKKEFRLFGLPNPQAFFGGQKKGAIGRTDAKSIPLLIAKLEDNPLDCPFTVVSYKVKCNATDPPWDLASNGKRMTGAIQKRIGKTPKGLDIKFHKIKVVGPGGGTPKEIQPITLTLK
jgi:gliding motility-associated protein GldM